MSQPLVEFVGLGALSAINELIHTLIEKRLLTKEEAVSIFSRSAEQNEQAAKKTKTDANEHAAKILRECEADMKAL